MAPISPFDSKKQAIWIESKNLNILVTIEANLSVLGLAMNYRETSNYTKLKADDSNGQGICTFTCFVAN